LNRLTPLIRIKRNLNDLSGHPGGLEGLAVDDLAEDALVNQCVSDVLETLIPGFTIPHSWYFRTIPIGDGFFIDTNYDFARLNSLYHQRVSEEDSSITGPYLVNHLFDARVDLQIAAGYMAELLTTHTNNRIMSRKLNAILTKRGRNQEQIEVFQTSLLQNAHALGDAINAGERSFTEFMALLDKSRRMKAWLKAVNPDDQILNAYYQDLTASTWIARLPAKTLRFALTTGVQALLPIVGTVLAAADATIVEKLRIGWRPDQFVNRVLKPFVYAD
jgi:hypothetical protein